jgi:RNA polymerase-binding transcription factor DksA
MPRTLSRRDELKRLLEDRRRELVATVHERMRVVRAEHGTNAHGSGLDDGEVSEVDIQEDLELALIQMRAETLGRIEESLARLEAGVYGHCSSCDEEIGGPACAHCSCAAALARNGRKRAPANTDESRLSTRVSACSERARPRMER